MSNDNIIEIWNLNRYPCHFENGYWDYQDAYGYDLDHLLQWSKVYDDCDSKAAISLLLTGTLNTYGWLLKCCLDLGATSVVDIGCGHGQQSIMFAASGIDYLGMEADPDTPFYGSEFGINHIYGTWPDMYPEGYDMAISAHCIGTNCAWSPEILVEQYPKFAGHCFETYFDELFELYPNNQIIAYECPDDNLVVFPDDPPLVQMMLGCCWH